MDYSINFLVAEKLEEQALKTGIIILIVGIIVHPLWIIFDYLLVPEMWKHFAYLRISVTIFWIVLLFLMKYKKMHWKFGYYLATSSINIIIAYMINVVPVDKLSAYFAGFSTVISVVAFFIYYSWYEYLIVLIIALLSVLLFNLWLGRYEPIVIFANGGMTYFSIGVFGAIFTEIKLKSAIREIEANIKLQKANEELKSINEELNNTNEELKIVNEQLNEQKQKLIKQNAEILDSIRYAYYLQSAVLNNTKILDKYFEYFFLYLPRDIVSGDFLWSAENEDYIYIGLADSTGHGVPGAMVSIFCNNALNDAFASLKNHTPAKILNKTREIITNTFLTKGKEIKDGMDISLIAIKKDKSKILFASANNSICIFKKDSSIEKLRGNKMPVGLYFINEEFKDIEINPENIKMIYLYSDGYADQFGGEEDKKLMFKNFKRLLKRIGNLSLEEQHKKLKDFITTWQGDNEQTDDISVLGIKLF